MVFNAHTVGYFKGTTGLRQEDPISSYIFILIMEIFTLVIQKQVELKNFSLHPKCRNPMITTIAFVDDLTIFTKPTVKSLQTIMDTLTSFYNFFKLQINQKKSHLLIAGLSDIQK